jgi:hypothetical protein
MCLGLPRMLFVPLFLWGAERWAVGLMMLG